MKSRWAAWTVVLATVAALGHAATAGATTPSATPQAVVETSSVAVGQLLRVTGTGWGTGYDGIVNLVICGNNALDATVDCAVDNTVAGGIRPGGSFFAAITVMLPPLPCPCLLRITSAVTPVVLEVPLTISGAPVATPYPRVTAPQRGVIVTNVHLKSSWSWVELFGGHPRRVVTYDVTNTSNITLHNPGVTITWGKGSDPTSYVQASDVGDLGINRTKSFQASIPFHAFSFGSYRVIVKVDPLGKVGVSATTTTVIPWGLVASLVIGLQLGLIRVRNRIRARSTTGERVESGWYPEPGAAGLLRLWDGTTWTEHTRAVSSPGMAPGWYADPVTTGQVRAWDGAAWTDATRPAPIARESARSG